MEASGGAEMKTLATLVVLLLETAWHLFQIALGAWLFWQLIGFLASL
jgi:hypothetical protein